MQHVGSAAPFQGDDELLTVHEVGGILKLSTASIYRLVEQRAIPFHRLRGGLRFRTGDVRAFLEKCRVESMR